MCSSISFLAVLMRVGRWMRIACASLIDFVCAESSVFLIVGSCAIPRGMGLSR